MNIENYKTKLQEEKRLLEEELANIGKVDNTGDWQATPENEMNSQEVPDEADIADRAEDFEERSSKLDILEKRLKDIDEALLKIEKGAYGICEVCGSKIEEDRLGVNSAARTCKSCMNKN